MPSLCRTLSSQYLRNVVSAQAFARADELDGLLAQSLTAAEQAPGFTAGNQLAVEPAPSAGLNALLIELIGNFGTHSRNAVSATVPAERATD